MRANIGNLFFLSGLITDKLVWEYQIKGETKVIATIKAEIDSPDVCSPNMGKLDFFVDWYIELFTST